MKKISISAVLILATASLVGTDASAREVKKDERTIAATGLHQINIEHPVGDLELIGGSGERVTIEMTVSCGKWFSGSCRDKAEQLELETEEVGAELFVRIGGMPNSVKSMSIDMTIHLPRHFGAEIEHGVGETLVTDLEGDISVELGVGDILIRGDSRHFEKVSAEVGVGDADLRVDGRRPGKSDGFLFLGNEVEWNGGRGQSEIEIEVGVGDADVRLD